MTKRKEDALRKQELRTGLQTLISQVNPVTEETQAGIELRNRFMVPPPKPAEITPQNPFGFHDIITFVEHPYYLGQRLHPAQRVVLKGLFQGWAGNQYLTIDNEKDDTCDHCVWKYAKEKEEQLSLIDMVNNPQSVRGLLPPERVPCLDCVRFNSVTRKQRFEQFKSAALNRHALSQIEDRSSQEPTDQFCNERMLLNHQDIPEETRIAVNHKLDSGRKFTELVLVIGRRGGKPLSIKTEVPTPNGWTTLGRLKLGDYVYDKHGNPTEIIGITSIMRNQDCYELVFESGETLIAGAGHEWIVNSAMWHGYGETNWQLKTTEEIYALSGLRSSRHKFAVGLCDPIKNEGAKLPLDPYIMGLFLNLPTPNIKASSRITKGMWKSFTKRGYEKDTKCKATSGLRLRRKSDGATVYEITGKLRQRFRKHHGFPVIYTQASWIDKMYLIQGMYDAQFEPDLNLRIETTSAHFFNCMKEIACSVGLKFEAIESNMPHRIFKAIVYMTEPMRDVKRLDRPAMKPRAPKYQHGLSNTIVGITPVPRTAVKCIEVDNDDHQFLVTRSYIPTHNSFIAADTSLYKVAELIWMKNPHAYYNKMGDPIIVLNVAGNADQGDRGIYGKIIELATTSPFLNRYMVGEPLSDRIELATPSDLDKYEELKKLNGEATKTGSIHLISGNSSAGGQVGSTIYCLIIDEMAELAEKGIAENLYGKLTASLGTFSGDGLVITISNPLEERGKFYELYRQSFIRDDMLMFQMPTWVFNPTLTEAYLESERNKDPYNYDMYYGARFGKGAKNPFVIFELVDLAFRPGRRLEIGTASAKYYAHLDPATNSDNYTLVVVHSEPTIYVDNENKPKRRIVVDHIHIWRPGPNREPIETDEVNRYILNLTAKFQIQQVSYDQWDSVKSIQFLQANGVNAVKRQFTPSYKKLIYDHLQELLVDHMLAIYEEDTMIQDPLTRGEISLEDSSEMRQELKQLKRTMAYGKIRIEAPKNGKDDLADALAAAAYECAHTEIISALPQSVVARAGRW